MTPTNHIPDPLIDLLDAVGSGDLDRKIPACGRVLRVAREYGLVLDLEREPYLSHAGLNYVRAHR